MRRRVIVWVIVAVIVAAAAAGIAYIEASSGPRGQAPTATRRPVGAPAHPTGSPAPPATAGAAPGLAAQRWIDLVSKNSSIPYRPRSRPKPDCLYPPKGACGLNAPPFTST